MSFFSKLSKATSSMMNSAASSHAATRQRVERQLSNSNDPRVKARLAEVKARSAEMEQAEQRMKDRADNLYSYAVTKESKGAVRSPGISNMGQQSGNRVAKEPININTAGMDELIQLPGIGSGIAKRILANRVEYGDFKSVDDLTRVNGIGDGIYQGLKDMIVVDTKSENA